MNDYHYLPIIVMVNFEKRQSGIHVRGEKQCSHGRVNGKINSKVIGIMRVFIQKFNIPSYKISNVRLVSAMNRLYDYCGACASFHNIHRNGRHGPK
jgi:hypothetical protein